MELHIHFDEQKLQELVDKAMEQFKEELDKLWLATEEKNEVSREHFN